MRTKWFEVQVIYQGGDFEEPEAIYAQVEAENKEKAFEGAMSFFGQDPDFSSIGTIEEVR